MSRPKKQIEARRGEVITFRVDPEEARKLESRVKASGLAKSEFLRQAALKTRVVVRKEAAVNAQYVVELNRIGVNLNQLVRSVHIRGEVPARVHDICDRIEELIMEAIKDES